MAETDEVRLISDDVLGQLLRITMGFIRPYRGRIKISDYKQTSPAYLSKQLSLTLLARMRPNVLSLKTTIGPRTVNALKFWANNLDRKLATSFGDLGPDGVMDLSSQSRQLSSYADYIENKYKDGENVEYEDEERLIRYHVSTSLLDQLIVSNVQFHRLKNFIENYSYAYKNRILTDQEELPLPDVLADQLLSVINSERFMKMFGTKRVAVRSSGLPYFCHSLMYLMDEGQIKLLGLEQLQSSSQNRNTSQEQLVWKAILDNKSIWELDTIGHVVQDNSSANRAYSHFIANRLKEQQPTDPTQAIPTTATKKGLWLRWNVLKLIWSIYVASGRADSISVPVDSLRIGGRGPEVIDSIVEGISTGGGFKKWERKDQHYDIQGIDHDLFLKIFNEAGQSYRNIANGRQHNKKTKQKSQVNDLLKWHGLELNTNSGLCTYSHTGKKTTLKCGRLPFKMLELLIKKDGGNAMYGEFYKLDKSYFKEEKLPKEAVKNRIKGIRRQLGVNMRKAPALNFIQDVGGDGFRLVNPTIVSH